MIASPPWAAHQGAISYRVNAGSLSGIDDATAAIGKAAQAWYTHSNADVYFDYVGDTSTTASAWDTACTNGTCTGGNLIVGRDFGHCDDDYSAVRFCANATCTGARTQVFIIEVNTRAVCDFGFTAALPTTPSQVGLQALLVHEFGHALGMSSLAGEHASVPTSVMVTSYLDEPHFVDAELLRDYYGTRGAKTLYWTGSNDGYTWDTPYSANVSYVGGRVGAEYDATPYAMIARPDSRAAEYMTILECNKYSGNCSSSGDNTTWHDFGSMVGPTVAYDWEGSTGSEKNWIVAWPEHFESANILYAYSAAADAPPWSEGSTSVEQAAIYQGDLESVIWAKSLYPVGTAYDPLTNRFYLTWTHYGGRFCPYSALGMNTDPCDRYEDASGEYPLASNMVLLMSADEVPLSQDWRSLELHDRQGFVSREGVSIACANDASLTRNCVLAFVDIDSSHTIKVATVGFNADGTIRSVSTPAATPTPDEAHGTPDVEWSPTAGWVLVWRGTSMDCATDGLLWYYSFSVSTGGTITWGTRGSLSSSYKSPLSPTAATRKLGPTTPERKYLFYVGF